MRFSDVVKALSDVLIGWRSSKDPEITDVEVDSSKVRPGVLFLCRKGYNFDSHDIAPQVVENGAVALVVERDIGNLGVPMAVVSDSRTAEAILASMFTEKPHENLLTFGITGTNGKTTTVQLMHHVLSEMRLRGSMISTVHYDIMGRKIKHVNTTPGSLEIFRYMRETLDRGGSYFILEVSSHALAQKRVYSMRFNVAGLTNVTRDHLDFHRSLEEYMRVKFSIFDLLKPDGIGVINSLYFPHFKSKRFRKVFYGDSGEYVVENVKVSLQGTEFDLITPFGKRSIRTKMIGDYNAYNVTLAIASLVELGFDLDEVVNAVATFPGVEGRFERIKEAKRLAYEVIVDFAHTPDALEKVIKNARKFLDPRGRIIVVFGAGGQSDRGKREIMGRVVGNLADIAILTTDDPRGEDPNEIIEDVKRGMSPDKTHLILPDRREAIETALTLAGKKDIVIIAGRGHEEMQIFDETKKVPFKDSEVVREIVEKKLKKR